MKLEDLRKPKKEESVVFVQRVKQETKDYLNNNRVDLNKLVEILKLEDNKK